MAIISKTKGRYGNAVIDEDMGWMALKKEVLESTAKFVTVGVHEEEAERSAVRHPKEAMISNVDAAVFNEFGVTITTPDGGKITIPSRPFLRLTLVRNQRRYFRVLKRFAEDIATGDKYTIDMALTRVGEIIERDIKKNIKDGGVFKELKPNTIAKRKWKGNEDTRPLYDSQQLYNSIKYKLSHQGYVRS